MVRVEDYIDIVGDNVIAEIYRKSTPLLAKDVVHINSTHYGGGVAEMLKTLVPLMNDIGIDAEWRVLHGSPDFFAITKNFHNALQGDKWDLTSERKDLYKMTNQDYSIYTHLEHDYVIIHDPQPLSLIKFYRKKQPWYWRCHIDLSDPHKDLWDFLKRFVLRYDRVIISNQKYKNDKLPVDQNIIYPAIDPLSTKNMDLNDKEIDKHVQRMDLPLDKPLITQVSRFDKWKDPVGVIDVFKRVKEKVDCRLVLCGSMASDDPEGYRIYDDVKKAGGDLIDKGDLIIQVNEKDLSVNALQRVSSVVVQKSIKEGFGLTATEALWKGTPVVSSNVGGLSIQIQDGINGHTTEPMDNQGFADRIVKILRDKEHAEKISREGKETVRKKFLITRLLLDYLNLMIGDLDRSKNMLA